MINDILILHGHIKAKTIGKTRLEISDNNPDPICLRTKFNFVLLFFDFIIRFHFCLSVLIHNLTFSKSLLFSIRLYNFSLLIRLNTTSKKYWIVSALEFEQKNLNLFWREILWLKVHWLFLIFFFIHNKTNININLN